MEKKDIGDSKKDKEPERLGLSHIESQPFNLEWKTREGKEHLL